MRFSTSILKMSTAAAFLCSLTSKSVGAFAPRSYHLRVPNLSNSNFSYRTSSTNQLENLKQEITRLFSDTEEEIDPGTIEGTDLRVLKYPHPSLRNENSVITQEELDSGEIKKNCQRNVYGNVRHTRCGTGSSSSGH